MNYKNRRIFLLKAFLIICAFFPIFLFCSDTYAMEGTSNRRIIWDNIMLFVNFGILVFAFIKFAKDPLMNFLHGERKKVEEEIDEIEKQVKDANSLMQAEANKLDSIDKHIEEMREHILGLGKKEKEKIIERAQVIAHHMIEDAKNEAEWKLETAKKSFGEEMLNFAIVLAVKELRKGVSEEDNEKIVDQFAVGLSTEKARFA